MSNAQDPDQVFDLDRDFIAPGRTPPLKPIKPSFRVEWSPPPFGPDYPSSDSSSEDEIREIRTSARRKIRKGRTNPSLTDGVLIRALNPNQPEAAKHAERYALASASQSEAKGEEENGGLSEEARVIIANATIPHKSDVPEQPDAWLEATSDVVQDTDGDFPMVDSPATFENADRTPSEAVPREMRISCIFNHQGGPMLLLIPDLLNWASEGLRLQLGNNHWDPDGSIVTSPILGKYAITPRDPDPDIVLPAMQMSPTRSSATSSPRQEQRLPSFRTHLLEFEARSPGFAGMSPILGGPSPGQWPHLGPSPPFHQSTHTGMSPPALPTHTILRTATRDSSISISSEYTPGSSAAVSTPASSIIVQSPATSANLHPMTPLQEQEQEQELELAQEEEKITLDRRSPERPGAPPERAKVPPERAKVRPERPQGQVTKVEVKDRRSPERPKGQVAKVEVTVKLDLLPPKEKAKDPQAPSRPVPSGRITCNGTFERAIQIETVTTLYCARSSATGKRAQDVAAEDECALPLYSNYYRRIP
ncbi:hypothetical protein LTR41_011628 [Exophiala xenobiotica]|nr:hypothetical protein LTR41_011628 [Exophiala xenobiotica]